ncbi:NUDIX hydrolase [Patescibacteria group bacterium]|nr:NUDIX hydrolase [Patescibacteria group bacterium]
MNKTVQAAVKAIVQKEDKFLVIKQEFGNQTYWDLPGGRVDHGESPYDTLIREVKEETALDITIDKPLGMFWFFRFDNIQIVATTFLCTPQTDSVDLAQNPAVEDITEFIWVTRDEFLSDKYHVQHQSLKELIKKL